MIPYTGEQTEEHRPERCQDPSDVITETRAGRSEQGGKERRQVHREQGEATLAKADERHARKETLVSTWHGIGRHHNDEVCEEAPANGGTVSHKSRDPGSYKVSQN